MDRTSIRDSLVMQLQVINANLDHFVDLIDDYMSLWDVKQALLKDIKKRGVTYKDVSAAGHEMMKNNPSVKELVGISRQMLAILKDLGINTKSVPGGGADGEEM
jgi:phage terminase small subunit